MTKELRKFISDQFSAREYYYNFFFLYFALFIFFFPLNRFSSFANAFAIQHLSLFIFNKFSFVFDFKIVFRLDKDSYAYFSALCYKSQIHCVCERVCNEDAINYGNQTGFFESKKCFCHNFSFIFFSSIFGLSSSSVGGQGCIHIVHTSSTT